MAVVINLCYIYILVHLFLSHRKFPIIYKLMEVCKKFQGLKNVSILFQEPFSNLCHLTRLFFP